MSVISQGPYIHSVNSYIGGPQPTWKQDKWHSSFNSEYSTWETWSALDVMVHLAGLAKWITGWLRVWQASSCQVLYTKATHVCWRSLHPKHHLTLGGCSPQWAWAAWDSKWCGWMAHTVYDWLPSSQRSSKAAGSWAKYPSIQWCHWALTQTPHWWNESTSITNTVLILCNI